MATLLLFARHDVFFLSIALDYIFFNKATLMIYLRTILLAAVIICGSFLLYFLYSKYFGHVNDRDIVLSEEQEEYKRKPIDPGGIIIPHSSSLIYEKLNPGSVAESGVNLLASPEEPMDLGFRSNFKNIDSYDSIDDILAKLDLDPEEAAIKNATSTVLEADIVTDLVNPVVTNNIIPDNDKDVAENIDQADIYKLKITKLAEETNKLYNLNINSVDSGFKIQLSSAWSEKEAKSEWYKIQVRHIKYLKNAQLIIKKVKVNNDRIIYLVMAGNYSSLNQAKLVCKKLVLSKQNCIVTK